MGQHISSALGCDRKRAPKRPFVAIGDNHKTLREVTSALRRHGVESCSLVCGVDFTASNKWTGPGETNLHALSPTALNQYELALHIISKTIEDLDDDGLIPCFGFGSAQATDKAVFNFNAGGEPCAGFAPALNRYREIAANVRMAGPTSFGPIIRKAARIAAETGQYHVLLLLADGQVTRSVDQAPGTFSAQEEDTRQAIVEASKYPLAIVMVGVGVGPWGAMEEFDDALPDRDVDNFQFVPLMRIFKDLSRPPTPEEEAAFALAALQELPSHHSAFGALAAGGHSTRRLPPAVTVLEPPPTPVSPGPAFCPPKPNSAAPPSAPPASAPAAGAGAADWECPVCLTEAQSRVAFGCGHLVCADCSEALKKCPVCRKDIALRLPVYG